MLFLCMRNREDGPLPHPQNVQYTAVAHAFTKSIGATAANYVFSKGTQRSPAQIHPAQYLILTACHCACTGI